MFTNQIGNNAYLIGNNVGSFPNIDNSISLWVRRGFGGAFTYNGCLSLSETIKKDSIFIELRSYRENDLHSIYIYLHQKLRMD